MRPSWRNLVLYAREADVAKLAKRIGFKTLYLLGKHCGFESRRPHSEMKRKTRIRMMHHRDDLLQRIKEFWGKGTNRSKQARRLVDGDIELPADKDAIQALAMVVNLQIALDDEELKDIVEETTNGRHDASGAT